MNFISRALNTLFRYAAIFATVALFILVASAYIATTRTPMESSIVKILNPEGTGGGTGWSVRYKGHSALMTNDHVCTVAQGGYVTVEQDSGRLSIKKIIKRNFMRDLCLVDGVPAPTLSLAKNGPSRFDQVRVMGHPLLKPTAESTGQFTGSGIIELGLSPSEDGTCPETAEQVESLFGNFCVQRMEVGFTTVPIAPGNSGSPVVNMSGEVIGVMNSGDNVIHHGNFIPLEYVKEMLND